MAEVQLKKRRRTENGVEVPSKKKKKGEKSDKKDKKGKHKVHDVLQASKAPWQDQSPLSEFKVAKASIAMSIPPIFAGNPLSGVEEMLDSLVMRYVPTLQGVMLCHSNTRFLNSTAIVKDDCPFLNCPTQFEATVWSPKVGMKLTGRVNLCSPDHISLLMHETFNVAIPRHHIPTENWVFEYGPAENDPEFGTATNEETGEDENIKGDGASAEHGRWIHKTTGEVLGGISGLLEFTVIGCTIANQMLSLLGSLQPDPFSEKHIAKPATLSEPEPRDEMEVDHVGREDEEEEDEEEDAFRALGRMGDEAEELRATQIAGEAPENSTQTKKSKPKTKHKPEEDESKTRMKSEKRKKKKLKEAAAAASS